MLAASIEAIGIALLVVLLLSISSKFRHWQAFRRMIGDVSGLPTQASGVMAVAVAIVEGLLIASFPLAWHRASGRLWAFATTLLFLSYTLSIAKTLVQKRAVACTCFALDEAHPLGPIDLGRNIALTSLAAFCWAFLVPAGRTPTLVEDLLSIGSGGLLGLYLMCLPILIRRYGIMGKDL